MVTIWHSKFGCASLFLALSLVFLFGCKPSNQSLLEQGQAAMMQQDYPGALLKADAVLEYTQNAEQSTERWQAEVLRLEVLSKTGKGAEALAALRRLREAYPKKMDAGIYLRAGVSVQGTGDTMTAINILDEGKRRFAGQADLFIKQIEAIKNSPQLDQSEIEHLKALGYM